MFLEKLRRFMYGRYGTDTLNLVLLIAGLAIALVDQQRLLVAGYRAFIIELGQVAVALGRERFNLAHCVNPRGNYERRDGEQYNAGE